MRPLTDAPRLQAFMDGIGRSAKGPGRVYLVGGATALLLGIRPQTVDIDIKLDPEPAGVFEAIAELKESLGVNVELSSPDDFVPALPGWRERSQFIVRHGQVEFFHYDFYGQALAKISRGHAKDLADARALVELGLVSVGKLAELFEEIKPMLMRYPRLNPDVLEGKVIAFAKGLED